LAISRLAIEICVNSDSDYETAKRNAAWLAADIFVRHRVTVATDSLFQHASFARSDCPRRIRAEGKWPEFIATVQEFIFEAQRAEERPVAPREADAGS
jgi:N-acetylmuramoyl-L-alanine amidase